MESELSSSCILATLHLAGILILAEFQFFFSLVLMWLLALSTLVMGMLIEER
jgi:hypothetical protein